MKKINQALLEEVDAREKYPVLIKNNLESILSPALIQILRGVQKELATIPEAEKLSQKDTNELVYKIAEQLGFNINTQEKDSILAYLEKEMRPFGILQDLTDDPEINDIIISAYNKIIIQKGRKNFKTQLSFASQEDYRTFVEKLLTKTGTSYSTKMPIADGMIGSYARIHAVHSTLCEEGPYLTIRLNRHSEILTKDLINFGLAPEIIMNYLGALVRSGQTILIAGEVGTGKTTLARALAACIPTEESILVIEDTAEITLVHPHVRYLRTRSENMEGSGKIAPGECIRAGMRMAMNRIIFGEIRDAEAAESFIDVCASGHPGISTIHARSAADTIARLELFLGRAQKGASREVITRQISNAVQVVLHINICKLTGQRRIMEIREIGNFADGALRQKTIFQYTPENNDAAWQITNRISNFQEILAGQNPPVVINNLTSKIKLHTSYNLQEAA